MQGNTIYYVRARHRGSSLGYSEWSDPVAFKTLETGSHLDLNYKTFSDLDADAQELARYGYAVALSSDGIYLAVSSPESMSIGGNRGKVTLYQREKGDWRRIKEFLSTADVLDGEMFGSSLYVSPGAEYIMIGAANKKLASGEFGDIYLFHRTAVDSLSWVSVPATDFAPGLISGGSRFGRSLAVTALDISDKAVFVGADEWTPSGETLALGAVFVHYGAGSSLTDARVDHPEINYLITPPGFGKSVAVTPDGSTLVVGAYRDPVVVGGDPLSALKDGSVYVFHLVDGVYEYSYRLINPMNYSQGQFGYSVAINDAGDLIIVSSYKDDAAATDGGSLYYFRKDIPTGDWNFESRQALDGVKTQPGLSERDGGFGASLSYRSALSELYVGMDRATLSKTKQGKVLGYISQANAPSFQYDLKLTNDTPYFVDSGGYSALLLDETKFYIGINSDNSAGALATYRETINTAAGNPTESTIFDVVPNAMKHPTLSEPGDGFGRSIALKRTDYPGHALGDYLAVGSPGKYAAAGLMSYFSSSVATGVTLLYTFVQPDPVAGDMFGHSCACTFDAAGDKAMKVFIGAPGRNNGQGAVYVYDVSYTEATLVEIIPQPDYGTAQMAFGSSVAVSQDGLYLAIGAEKAIIQHNGIDNANEGCVYTYAWSAGSSAYVLDQTLYSPQVADHFDHFFGCSCSYSQDSSVILIGARSTWNYGKAYVFKDTTGNFVFSHGLNRNENINISDIGSGTFGAAVSLCMSGGSMALVTSTYPVGEISFFR